MTSPSTADLVADLDSMIERLLAHRRGAQRVVRGIEQRVEAASDAIYLEIERRDDNTETPDDVARLNRLSDVSIPDVADSVRVAVDALREHRRELAGLDVAVAALGV